MTLNSQKKVGLVAFSQNAIIQYNTVKPKTFKPNLLNEPKDILSLEFFFIYAFFKTETISEPK